MTLSLNQDLNTPPNDDGYIHSSDYLLGHAVVQTSTPHLELVTKETMKHAQNAIVNLPKKYRRICNLYFNHNYRMVDIADMTKKPLNTVKGEIHKARKVLQKQLVKI